MSGSLVLVAQTGAVCTLTLNRPQALNSFDTALHIALRAALDGAAADPSVRCVVLTGAGRAFCAGQDLGDPALAAEPQAPCADAPAADDALGHVITQFYNPLLERLRSMPVPVLAAVNGVAAGAGANLALACDIVVAARSASFIQAFARIGLIPDTGGTWLLPRLAGRARALGLAMLGDRLPAEQAAAWGLIWQCVDDAELPGHVEALAQRLAALPTRALVETRRAFDAAQLLDLPQAAESEGRLQAMLGASHDYREGVEAFFAKRAPRFTDR